MGAPGSPSAHAGAPPRIGVIAAVLAATTVVAVGSSLVGVGDARGPIPWWACAILIFAAESVALRFRVFGTPHAVSPGGIAMVVALGLLSPIGFVVARVTGALGVALVERKPFSTAAFNVSLGGLEAVVIVVVHAALIGSAAAVSVTGGVSAVVAVLAGSVLASLVVTLALCGGVRRLPRGFGRMVVLGNAVELAAAVLGGLVLVSFSLGDAVGAGVLLAAGLVVFEVDVLRRRS
jgi:hypothetical protein